MIDEVEVFETNDGKLFKSKRKAEQHELDQVSSLLDERLKPLMEKGWISASEKYRIINTIVGSHEELQELFRHMKKILDEKPLVRG